MLVGGKACLHTSTKSGKTVSCMARLFEQALFLGKPGRQVWWICESKTLR
jgi:hypothetical protein